MKTLKEKHKQYTTDFKLTAEGRIVGPYINNFVYALITKELRNRRK
jgi:hypothetical protein